MLSFFSSYFEQRINLLLLETFDVEPPMPIGVHVCFDGSRKDVQYNDDQNVIATNIKMNTNIFYTIFIVSTSLIYIYIYFLSFPLFSFSFSSMNGCAQLLVSSFPSFFFLKCDSKNIYQRY
jgi:hypothetical protein